MKKRKKVKDDDLDFDNVDVNKLIRVPDFLPPPAELTKAKTVITMNLDADTVAFFKREAMKKGGKYQRMMRKVLERYAEYYSKGKDAA